MNADSAAKRRAPFRTGEDWAVLVLPSLMLISGFLHYLLHHQYGVLRPEASGAVGLLLAAGSAIGLLLVAIRSTLVRAAAIALLLLFIWDIQFKGIASLSQMSLPGGSDVLRFGILIGCLVAGALLALALHRHLATILASGFAVLLIATLAFPSNAPNYGPRLLDTISRADEDLPPVVHLVLDAHSGLDGIPMDIEGGPELRQALLNFYLENGFRVFGSAYSAYFVSRQSIGALVNPSAKEFNTWLRPDAEKQRWLITENELFDLFAEQGYLVRVYQTEYMDFCRTLEQRLELCDKHPAASLRLLRDLDAPLGAKTKLLILLYLERGRVYNTVTKVYDRLSGFLERQGWGVLPLRTRHSHSLFSLGTLALMDRLKADLEATPEGRLFFAHLMLPHAPFILGPDCRVRRDVDTWRDRKLYHKEYTAVSTPAYRDAAYKAYFDQTRCLMTALSGLFDALRRTGLWERATIILHGDHGSRITLRDPSPQHLDALSPRDLIDSYSALYAIRSPELTPGYDVRMASIQDLYAEHIFGRPATNGEAVVHTPPGRRNRMQRIPMVPIEPGEPGPQAHEITATP